MPDGATLNLDIAAFRERGDKITREYLAVGTAAVRSATRGLEKKLEAATQAAVPGRLWRAWQSSTFPGSGPAINPVGTIWIKGGTRTRGAIKFWTEPGEIRGKRGQYLAVALPAAGSRGRARDLTPEAWTRRTGIELRFVARPGKAPLLVADNAVLSGRGRTARANTPRRIAAGRASATVAIFVLLPLLRFRNAVAVAPLVAESEQVLVRDFLNAAQIIA